MKSSDEKNAGARKVGELCDLQNGNGFRPPEWREKGLPIIRIQNLNGSRDFNYFDGPISEKWLVRPGDLLFAWAGVKGVSFGPTIWSGPQGVLNQHIFRVTPKPGIDKEWLFQALKLATARIEAQAHGFKASLVHVQKSEITNQEIATPSFAEQRRIASVLNTWDDAINTLDRLSESKLRLIQSLYNQFFLPCHPKMQTRPPEWRRFKLASVFSERVEFGTDADELLSITMDRGVIPRDEVGRIDTSPADKSAYKLICPGDIGYNTMRMWQGVSGLSALRGVVSPAYTVVVPDNQNILGGYAVHLFKSRRMIFEFERFSQGLTSDTWSLKYPRFAEIEVWLPPIEIQAVQAELLDAARTELNLLSRLRSALQCQKRGLMQRILTGKWRVPGDAT